MSTLSDAELDTLIRARLALAGVDLDLLPAERDPVTGAPSRDQAMGSLRRFLLDTPGAISGWRPPPADPRLSQQSAPPAVYPSILREWTK